MKKLAVFGALIVFSIAGIQSFQFGFEIGGIALLGVAILFALYLFFSD